MKRLFVTVVLAATILSSAVAYAAEKTVTLAVPGMYCASCPYIVKNSLMDVTGVLKVVTSLQNKTAVVTFDDAKTNVANLSKATAFAGYPSSVVK